MLLWNRLVVLPAVTVVSVVSALPQEAVAAQADMAAVVRIYTDSRQGAQLGAGFLIDCHTVATAYHVIQGATRLTVYGDRGSYPNPRVLAFDPLWDLALLTVDDPREPLPTPPSNRCPQLAISNQVPQGLTQRRAIAFGHPDGKLNFQVEVAFNRDRPLSAGQYFGPGGEEIFTSPDVQLIAIDATLQPGMSGGPVVVDGVAVGVVSGSQAPGGRTFGWAIPTFRLPRLQRLSNLSKSFASLPPLQLMKTGRSATLLKISRFPDAPLDRARLEAMVTVAEEVVPVGKEAMSVADALSQLARDGRERSSAVSPATAAAALDRAGIAVEQLQQASQRMCGEWSAFSQTIDRTYRRLSPEARARVQLPLATLTDRFTGAQGNCEALIRQGSADLVAMRASTTAARLRNGSIRRWNNDVDRELVDVSRRMNNQLRTFTDLFMNFFPAIRLILPAYNRLLEVNQYEKAPY